MKIQFSFSETASELQDKIYQREREMVAPAPKPMPPHKPTKQQKKMADSMVAFTNRGLVMSFPDAETWQMRLYRKQDSGRMDMPPREIEKCAEAMFR